MAENVPLPIANGFYVSDALIISAQQCINFYPNIVQAPALAQETLFGTAGLNQLATTGPIAQQNRGMLTMDNIPFVVNGDTLYRINRDTLNPDTFSTTSLGTITGTGRVSMATNGTQLVILVPGGLGSVWNEGTTTFTPDINGVDSDFTANGAPQFVAYVDGFFLFTTDEKTFIGSAINNALSYNSLDVATAESDPDDIVSLVVYKNQVLILGTITIEGFENIGEAAGGDFPFVRTGLFKDTGLLSPFSIIKGDDAFRFVGSDANEGPAIYEFRESSITKISNTAIDTVLQDLTDAQISEIFSMHYGQNGQFFTSFSIPSINETFEYNAVSGRWHQRQSFVNNSMVSWRVSSIVSAYGRLICADRLDGRIGELDEDLFTEYGDNILRQVDTMPFAASGKSSSVSSLELTMQPGVGTATTPNPQIRMSRSTDGGSTFTSELSRPIGKAGERKKRTIWRRLGRADRYEMFRFEMSDPVKAAIVMLQARPRAGLR